MTDEIPLTSHERGRWSAALQIAFWLVLVGTFVVSNLPHPPPVPGQPSDKLQHAAIFLGLTILGIAAYPGLRLLPLVSALAGFGALIELAQGILALNRHAELSDWIADLCGIAAGLLLVSGWRQFRPKT